ncbi:hypothetical protein DdX_18893 [Ditylenchus destructor]|uniref:Uncharacterized protein n=1 Tax=Ditylenchus destructor TaxID=166010 RepID=A0AAD4MIT2_9BILA|nr:hypothetical protein DdX_18893 [Ditylenchus destructor]
MKKTITKPLPFLFFPKPLKSATASWDETDKEIKPLAERIGNIKGRQFTCRSGGDVFQAIQSATASWDAHLIKEIKPLAERIGKYQGRQFTPADPVAMVGFLHPEMIEAPENYIVNIGQEDNKAGYKVELTKNDQSTITVVGGIDEDIFKNEMERSIRTIKKDQESQTEGGGNCIVM